MRKITLVVLIGLLLPAGLFAQAAAGPGGGRVAVVDFQKAVTENADGKKAQEKFVAEFQKRQKDFEEKQKLVADNQTKLQNGTNALSDSAKAELSRQIEKLSTELQRMNDDAQKDLGDLQQQLFRPIAEKAQEAIKSYSTENGFAVVFDSSSQASSIVFVQEVADITTEIIRRMDAAAAKAPAAPAATGQKPATPPASTTKPPAQPTNK